MLKHPLQIPCSKKRKPNIVLPMIVSMATPCCFPIIGHHSNLQRIEKSTEYELKSFWELDVSPLTNQRSPRKEAISKYNVGQTSGILHLRENRKQCKSCQRQNMEGTRKITALERH
jgi:hypothetical protein